jgi:RND superfamily putative drug exporter
VREERRRGLDARAAAVRALGATGGTVTSAAAVMIGVFSIFATLGLLEFKQLGFGLAVAILLDATIVRAVALPAAVTLLGRRSAQRQQAFSPVAEPSALR